MVSRQSSASTTPTSLPSPTAASSSFSSFPSSSTFHSSPAASVPLAFDPALLLAPQFDPHTFITSSLSSSTTLPALHASLTSYTSQLHLQLVSYLNLHYERFIALSSSLTGASELLSAIEEWAQQVKEKTAAVALVVEEGRREVEERMREMEEGEERVRWLRELQDVVERVKRVQAVVAELEEEREEEQRDQAGAAEEHADILRGVKDDMRPAVRRALDRARDGGGAEERRRREERRQKRREDGGKLPGDHQDVDEDDDDVYEADESVKRQHNQAYDLFLSILSSPVRPSSTASPAPSSPSPSLVSHLTHLTALFVSLNASLAVTSSFTLVSSLHSTVASLSASFHAHLARALVAAVRSSSPSLSSILHLYLLLDERHTAQSIVKDDVIVPHLASVVTLPHLKAASSPSSSALPSNLSSIYDDLLAFASRLLPQLTAASSFSPAAFDWWGDVFFSAVSHSLVALGPALFSPGGPGLFHYHYTLTTAFIDSLARTAAASGAEGFARLAVVDGFVKRWNVGIYYRLRFQAIASRVEAECARGGEEGVAVVDGVKTALLQCWSETVWLAELSGSFMKLTLQIVERYAMMVDQGCVVSHAPAAPPAAATAPGEGETAPAGVTAAFPTAVLFSTYLDVRELMGFVQGTLTSLITARLGVGNADVVEATLAPTVSRLSSLLPLLQSTLTSILSQQASPPLAHIARLPTFYRMTTKRPTQPSSYVTQLIRNLVTATSHPSLARWPPADRAALTSAIVASTAATMAERATTVLELAVRTEASLRMLRRGGGPGAAGAAADMSEVEKIRGQLDLDVHELERGLRDDLALPALHELTALSTTVRTAGLSTAP